MAAILEECCQFHEPLMKLSSLGLHDLEEENGKDTKADNNDNKEEEKRAMAWMWQSRHFY